MSPAQTDHLADAIADLPRIVQRPAYDDPYVRGYGSAPPVPPPQPRKVQAEASPPPPPPPQTNGAGSGMYERATANISSIHREALLTLDRSEMTARRQRFGRYSVRDVAAYEFERTITRFYAAENESAAMLGEIASAAIALQAVF